MLNTITRRPFSLQLFQTMDVFCSSLKETNFSTVRIAEETKSGYTSKYHKEHIEEIVVSSGQQFRGTYIALTRLQNT